MSDVKRIATRDSYGETLAELGNEHKEIVVLDADLAAATKTCIFGKAHPERFIDCGIAEGNMMGVAAGMAAKSGGIVGGAVAGGISVISNTIALANGEKDAGEALGCIARDTAGGALSGAGSAAVATVTGTAVASAVAGTAIAGTALGTACIVATPVVAALGVGCVISSIWNAIWD